MSANTLTLKATATGNTREYSIALTLTGPAASAAVRATVDYGDGSNGSTMLEPQSDGTATGTVVHVWPRSGQQAVTYTVTGRADNGDQTWDAVAAAYDSWDAFAAAYDSWEDASGVYSGTTTVTIEASNAEIVATPHADPFRTNPPTVELDIWTASGHQGTRWTISRSTNGADPVVIWWSNPPGATTTVTDLLAPLGVPLVYTLTVTEADGDHVYVSNSVTLEGPGARGCWLYAVPSMEAMPITVQSWDTLTWSPRQAIVGVQNNPVPCVLYDEPLAPATEIVFRTTTREQEARCREILGSGLVLLRTQDATSLEQFCGVVGGFRRIRTLTGDATSFVFQWSVPLQQVALPPSVGVK